MLYVILHFQNEGGLFEARLDPFTAKDPVTRTKELRRERIFFWFSINLRRKLKRDFGKTHVSLIKRNNKVSLYSSPMTLTSFINNSTLYLPHHNKQHNNVIWKPLSIEKLS